MRPQDVTELVGHVYDAATGALDWSDLGAILRSAFGAGINNIFLVGAGAERPTWLSTAGLPSALTADYFNHYCLQDPWIAAGARVMADPEDGRRVVLGAELIADAHLRETGFYWDFARHAGAFHTLSAGVELGASGFLAVSLLRPEDAGSFGEPARQAMLSLHPHFNRAMRLRDRLVAAEAAGGLGRAVLDALPIGVAIVDAGLRVVMANAALEHLAASADGPRLTRTGPDPGAGTVLGARRAADGHMLASLVTNVARGGAGGGMGFARGTGALPVAALVMPVPARLAPRAIPGAVLAPRLALVLLRDLDARSMPAAPWLGTLFGLTDAEASVAVAVVNNSTAEAIAAARGTSLATVRAQIRSILEKCGAANLRDLTRIFASFPDRFSGGPPVP